MPFPFEFVIFSLTLAGVMWFHHHNQRVALIGLAATIVYKLLFSDDHLFTHFLEELPLLASLFCLLVGFEIVAGHFHESGLANKLPAILPNDWKGGFVLLFFVFLLSIVLDNIASAVIGASVASTVFRGRVNIGYLAAIITASNAGGAGSVIGDTTTTMMWIDGVAWTDVLHAFVPSIIALCVMGIPISIMQDREQRITKDANLDTPLDLGRLSVVILTLLLAILANRFLNSPAIGVVAGVVIGPLVAQMITSLLLEHLFYLVLPLWICWVQLSEIRELLGQADAWKKIRVVIRREMQKDESVLVSRRNFASLRRYPKYGHYFMKAAPNAIFLMALVMTASLMPVKALPDASPLVAVGLGAISSVFDNIPLTKLALDQGGYDWGFLAFAVGYGGSMTWFGSSAGVMVASNHSRIKDMWAYLKEGFPIHIADIVASLSMYILLGWHPHAPHH